MWSSCVVCPSTGDMKTPNLYHSPTAAHRAARHSPACHGPREFSRPWVVAELRVRTTAGRNHRVTYCSSHDRPPLCSYRRTGKKPRDLWGGGLFPSGWAGSWSEDGGGPVRGRGPTTISTLPCNILKHTNDTSTSRGSALTGGFPFGVRGQTRRGGEKAWVSGKDWLICCGRSDTCDDLRAAHSRRFVSMIAGNSKIGIGVWKHASPPGMEMTSSMLPTLEGRHAQTKRKRWSSHLCSQVQVPTVSRKVVYRIARLSRLRSKGVSRWHAPCPRTLPEHFGRRSTSFASAASVPRSQCV